MVYLAEYNMGCSAGELTAPQLAEVDKLKTCLVDE